MQELKKQKEHIQPCKIVIIGLPYSGKKTVAKILVEKYECQFIDVQKIDKNLQYNIQVGKLCMQDFRKKSVLILEQCNQEILIDVKRKNFVNVVQVDATFKQRFNFYCTKNNKVQDLKAFQEFSTLDSNYHNSEYQECQKYVRVRILNQNGIHNLQNKINTHKNDIIRPFRPSPDQYFMKIADIAKRRSNCMKSSVGCVIVNDNNRVVSTGYNGTPRGLHYCYDNGCKRCNENIEGGLDECLCLHGEQSAILQVGIFKTFGCKLYTTLYPCFSCAKVIKQAGIRQIYYMTKYLKPDNGQSFLKLNYKPEDIIKVEINNIYY